MQIAIDDAWADVPGQTLGAVVQAASDRVVGEGRVVVEVQCDGQLMPPDDLQRRHDEDVSERRIELRTADPRQLAVSVLEQVRIQLNLAAEQQEEAATLLQQDRMVDAMQLVGEALGAWQSAEQAVSQGARLTGLDLESIEVEGHSASKLVTDLADKLVALRDAVAARDTIALADQLAYEWPETTGQWRALLMEMVARLEASDAPPSPQPGEGA